MSVGYQEIEIDTGSFTFILALNPNQKETLLLACALVPRNVDIEANADTMLRAASATMGVNLEWSDDAWQTHRRGELWMRTLFWPLPT